jgi:DNA-binding response OmpR family regulator
MNEASEIRLKDILEYEKYEVDLAEDGKKGLEAVKHTEYDIILCDIKMPGMDGIEVLEQLNHCCARYTCGNDFGARKHRYGSRINKKRSL